LFFVWNTKIHILAQKHHFYNLSMVLAVFNNFTSIAWRKLSVGIKHVEISKDQWHFSNCMFFRSWASNGGPKKWKIEISKMMLFHWTEFKFFTFRGRVGPPKLKKLHSV
jgi:hypothetical protein